MLFVFKRLALLLSIAAAFAADKETPFRPGPASSFANRQSNSQVTIAVDPYVSSEKMKAAFGKLRPTDYEVLPVLVVIQNDSRNTIRLDRFKAVYQGPGAKVEATPAKEVKYAHSVGRPRTIPGPTGPIPIKNKKNPLDVWEIEGRALTAQAIPPGQSAYGFVYFQAPMSD